MKVKLKDSITEKQFTNITFGGPIMDSKTEYEIFKNEKLTSELKLKIYNVTSPTTNWEYNAKEYKILFEEQLEKEG